MAAGDLTTLESFRAYCPGASSADDALIEDKLIPAYSAAVKTYLNRQILSGAVEVWRDGRGAQTLTLPEYPVTAITLLEIDGQAIGAQAGFGQPGYRFTPTQIILDGYWFTRGNGNIHVQFTAGYETPPVDISEAVNLWIALRYKERDRIGHQSKSLANETTSYITDAMPKGAKLLLQQFMRVAPL